MPHQPPQTPTIESAAKESASEEKTLIGGRSVARAAFPGNPREPGLLEDGSLQRTTGQANASYTAFFIRLKKCLSRRAMLETSSFKC